MAKAKIWARLIRKGLRSWDDVPGDLREMVVQAYNELFGE